MTTRVLCLGNDLLADDAFGIVAARELRRLHPGMDVVDTSGSGLDLLDLAVGADRLIVVDTVRTGAQDPGTVSVFEAEDIRGASGGSPHYIGLFEALALAKALGLAVPETVTIIAVEPFDSLTVGGEMHPSVHAALPPVLNLIKTATG